MGGRETSGLIFSSIIMDSNGRKGVWTVDWGQAVLCAIEEGTQKKNRVVEKCLTFLLFVLQSVMTGGDNELEWCVSVCMD